MEKKFSFSDQSTKTKIIYGAVIAILCFSAVIIGLVAANRKTEVPPVDEPPAQETPGDQTPPSDEKPGEEALTFTLPVSGEIMTAHSLTVPVYSETLGEWRFHTGVDIATEVAAPVYAAARGEVSAIYSDPMLGKTVEITHENGIVTKYSNLNATLAEGIEVGTALASGALLGVVGDTAVSEVGKEAHLHFGMSVNGASVNPMDYIEKTTDNSSTL
ncbi:MAG: M23 family metallopeptidase [Clostridia bacterium]|nr:M23 family metallopeptidase [Clostridia bacterium]